MKLLQEEMEVRLEVVVVVIKCNQEMKKIIYIFYFWIVLAAQLVAQETNRSETSKDSKSSYQKRVLESVEVDFLSSYYQQEGENAAVTGGIGTEALDDATATIIVSIPINNNDVLTINAGVSAYTSASSSNVNPFDSRGKQADPFVASSGESKSDVWTSGSLSYSHSSDDRNKIIGANIAFANEYDYNSVGVGANFSILTNDKNTEFSISASAFFDQWNLIYPAELQAMGLPGDDDDEDENFNINRYVLTGNLDYAPRVEQLTTNSRNSYAVGLGFSQIISKRLQGSLALDLVLQQGQLSTPFQRVYFSDKENTYIENFHLADDIERLPASRFKFALGGRLHYYINEFITMRSFYRFYKDDWSLNSHTASLEIPVKLFAGRIALYPSYRYYFQSGIKYFAPYDKHLSTSNFYTSDYDLSNYHAHQIGFGIGYNNLYGTKKLWKFDFRSIDLKYYRYNRNTSFNAHLVTLGIKFKI